MPVDREIIEVITTANMTGVMEAKAGFLGLSPAVLGAGLALAGLVFVGKAAIENSKALETATKQLEQAYATQGKTYAANSRDLEGFILTNQKYITNQYDVMTAMASLVRAGNNETDAMRMLNDALDLSVIKNEDVSVAAGALVKVLAGNSRALRELGITTDQYNAIMKNKLLTTEQKHAELLALIETRTAKGRETTDAYVQSQNALNVTWQKFTGQQGGPIIGILTKINEALATGIQLMDLYNKFVQAITGQGGVIQRTIHNSTSGGSFSGGAAGAGAGGKYGHSAASMSSGSQIHIHIDQGAYIDGPGIDMLTNKIAQRLRFTTGI